MDDGVSDWQERDREADEAILFGRQEKVTPKRTPVLTKGKRSAGPIIRRVSSRQTTLNAMIEGFGRTPK